MENIKNQLNLIKSAIIKTRCDCKKAEEIDPNKLAILCNRISDEIESLKKSIIDRSSTLSFNDKHRFNQQIYIAKKTSDLLEKGGILFQMIKIKYPTNDRKMPNASARQSAYRLMRDYGYTYTLIAKVFDKDHSTIINGCKSAENLIFVKDKKFLDIYTEIKDMFSEAFANKDVEDTGETEKPFYLMTEDEMITSKNIELCTQ